MVSTGIRKISGMCDVNNAVLLTLKKSIDFPFKIFLFTDVDKIGTNLELQLFGHLVF